MPALVLLSGGLDSAVALACAARDGGGNRPLHAISFDYGQRHRHELDAARRVAASLGVPPRHHVTIGVDLRAIGGSALTSDAIDVPKDGAGGGGIPITYVPARNLIFLSLAAALAETIGAREVYIGVNAVDYSGYPDCREPFIRAFEAAAALGTKAGAESPLRVRTPLVHMTKARIIRTGHDLGVDFSLTHSCYDPIVEGGETLACARCDSCLIRAARLREAGVPDPTRYALGSRG